MRLQANLGEMQLSGRMDLDNQGKIVLARVLKVYEDKGTADIMLMTNSFVGDNEETEGKISVNAMKGSAGWDDELKVAYGNSSPVHEGEIVVLGFIDSNKSKPVILGSFSPHVNYLTHRPRIPSEYDLKLTEGYEYWNVTRNQDYSYLNGGGEFEKVSSSRAYIVGKKEKMSDRRESAFDYEDLTLKNKYEEETDAEKEEDLKTVGLKEEDIAYFQPFNYLFQVQSQFEEKGATFTRGYLDAEKGVFRVSKDDNKELFMIEVDENNNFEIRLQLDSPNRRGEGSSSGKQTLRGSEVDVIEEKNPKNPSVTPNKETVRIKINNTGEVQVATRKGSQGSEVNMTPQGLSLNSTGAINIRSNSSITLNAPSVSVIESSPGVRGEQIIEG